MNPPAPGPPASADGAFRGTRFADPAVEDAYRRHRLASDGRTAAYLLGFFAFSVALYAVPEWFMLGGGATFRAMLAARAAYVAVTVGILVWALRASSWRRFDAVLFLALVALQAMMFASSSTRPRDFYMQVAIDVAVVNAIWTILPVRFTVQAASAALFLAGQILLLRWFRDPLPVLLRGPVVTAYVLAHGIGAAVAFRYHRVRRREWLAVERIRQDREELAAAREAADRANRAKSVFLAGVSHEILTPLNAILGFSDVLQRREPRPEDRRALEAIHAAGSTLHGLLVDVLDMARGEAAEAPLAPRPTDLGALLGDIHRILAARAAERGLEFHVSAAAIPTVSLDADRLRQVLLNLANNAIRFTHAGSVTIEAVAEPRPGGRVDLEVAVRDTGEGIPPEEQRAVFEPFRQRRGQDPERYGGSGLGLALSRHLVERMGGAIELESAPGRGSTFRVRLPGLEVIRMPEPRPDPGEWELGPCTLLVADDEPWNRELIRTYLSSQPVRIVEAGDGVAALGAAEAPGVDVALLDVQMPGLDGRTVAERLRSRGRRTPAIVVESAQPAPPAGPWDAWLRKPFDEGALLEALGPLIPGSRRAARPGARALPQAGRARIDPEWTAEASLLASAPHAGRARALADRVAAAARAAGDPALEEWAAGVRAAADALDVEALGARLRGLVAGGLDGRPG